MIRTTVFSLHGSSIYREFIDGLADRLVAQHSLANKTVLEIACGQGEFLHALLDRGIGRAIGVDPAIDLAKAINSDRDGLVLIRDLYSEKYADIECDFICCRHMINQIADPVGFLRMLRADIGTRLDTRVFVEAPNAAYTFARCHPWSIVYERCSWFTPESMSNMFQICGSDVVAAYPCYADGQYLGLEAKPAATPPSRDSMRLRHTRPTLEGLETFEQCVTQSRHYWEEQLAMLSARGQRVIAWGAGASAVSLLSSLRIVDEVPFVIDINPLRHGQYLPRTGQKVMPPDYILEYKPDVIIITNPTYQTEIQDHVDALGHSCRFMVL